MQPKLSDMAGRRGAASEATDEASPRSRLRLREGRLTAGSGTGVHTAGEGQVGSTAGDTERLTAGSGTGGTHGGEGQVGSTAGGAERLAGELI